VKAMSYSSGVRTQHVFDWVSLIWFTSVVSVAGSQGVELQVIPQVATECGKNVTLTCEASSSREMDIKLFSWLGRNKTMCQIGDGQADPEVLCENKAVASNHTLTLTLINVMPVDSGKYLCKLHSQLGPVQKSTVVTVQ
ncbi:uncharacterized protein AKAME5_001244500, partial [Lates japonicus]